MARKVRHALHDILEANERVETITHGETLAQFEESWERRRLVQRAIEIISEASRAIAAELTDTHPEIPWSQVRGIAALELPGAAEASGEIVGDTNRDIHVGTRCQKPDTLSHIHWHRRIWQSRVRSPSRNS